VLNERAPDMETDAYTLLLTADEAAAYDIGYARAYDVATARAESRRRLGLPIEPAIIKPYGKATPRVTEAGMLMFDEPVEREHEASMDCWCGPRMESYGDEQ
jgi:hypothetical protein